MGAWHVPNVRQRANKDHIAVIIIDTVVGSSKLVGTWYNGVGGGGWAGQAEPAQVFGRGAHRACGG